MAKRTTRAFVSMRLDSELLGLVDDLAEVEGLTRTDVIERLIRREFFAFRIVGPLSELRRVCPKFPWPVETEGGMVEILMTGGPVFKRKGGKA